MSRRPRAAGRAAGDLVVAHAQADQFFAPWSGTVPTGPGIWFSTASPPAPPVGVLFGQATPYFLTSGDQFRPAPPPAFGSPAFNADLAEVGLISDTRTAEQDAIAKFWAFRLAPTRPRVTGTRRRRGYIVAFSRRGEREAAHTLALANMAGFDAIIASHDAKFAYWLIRPSQADPGYGAGHRAAQLPLVYVEPCGAVVSHGGRDGGGLPGGRRGLVWRGWPKRQPSHGSTGAFTTASIAMSASCSAVTWRPGP